MWCYIFLFILNNVYNLMDPHFPYSTLIQQALVYDMERVGDLQAIHNIRHGAYTHCH
jgi:hypothetical protein